MLRRFILTLIRFYQKGISPVSPALCRFEPTCSEYARQAVDAHGAGRGAWLAARRLLRCRPFGPHGYDPVPAAESAPGSGKRLPSARPLMGDAEAIAGEHSHG